MPGIVAISGVIIGILSLRFPGNWSLYLNKRKLAFMLSGASLGFLIFNFFPAKIFPGYGATAIYLILAVASILSSAKLATAILVMGVPMIDGIFTISRRVLSENPFLARQKTFASFASRFRVQPTDHSIVLLIFSAILGALALVLTSRGKIFAIIMLVL